MALYPREVAFRKWLVTGKAGSIYNYYTGMLAIDRGEYILIRDEKSDAMVPQWVPNAEITALAEAAIEAWTANAVHLFQRRIKDYTYEYIAMKRSPHQVPLWMPDGALEIVDD
jgi:hypothetical protein